MPSIKKDGLEDAAQGIGTRFDEALKANFLTQSETSLDSLEMLQKYDINPKNLAGILEKDFTKMYKCEAFLDGGSDYFNNLINREKETISSENDPNADLDRIKKSKKNISLLEGKKETAQRSARKIVQQNIDTVSDAPSLSEKIYNIEDSEEAARALDKLLSNSQTQGVKELVDTLENTPNLLDALNNKNSLLTIFEVASNSVPHHSDELGSYSNRLRFLQSEDDNRPTIDEVTSRLEHILELSHFERKVLLSSDCPELLKDYLNTDEAAIHIKGTGKKRPSLTDKL